MILRLHRAQRNLAVPALFDTTGMWRNRQTRRSQKPLRLTLVWVRFPPSPSLLSAEKFIRQLSTQHSTLPMKKSEISFDVIPASAVSETRLSICLKCAFDFFTKQLQLAPRTAYSELRKH